MRMGPKSFFRRNAILVQDPQWTKRIMFAVVVSIIDEGVNINDPNIKASTTYEAKLQVWNVFNQPWSAFPRLSLGRRTSLTFEEDMSEVVAVAKSLDEAAGVKLRIGDEAKVEEMRGLYTRAARSMHWKARILLRTRLPALVYILVTAR